MDKKTYWSTGDVIHSHDIAFVTDENLYKVDIARGILIGQLHLGKLARKEYAPSPALLAGQPKGNTRYFSGT